MNEIARIDKPQARGLTAVMAERFQMEPQRFVEAIKATVIKGNVNEGQLAAFLMVAHEYGLNPLTKEVYAFPSNGGIQPIVSIDGWMKMVNSHPQFDGMEFQDHVSDDGKLDAVTCRIFRKDRSHPTEATEYMVECSRQTDPWKKWPRRMLRHKAAIQCARYAFSFAGIMDEDDFDRMKDVTPQGPTISERLEQAREATQDSQDEQEGFDLDHVSRETETRSSDYQSDDTAPNPSSDEGDEPPSSPSSPSTHTEADSSRDASDEGGGNPPPSPSPTLMEFAGICYRIVADKEYPTDMDTFMDAVNGFGFKQKAPEEYEKAETIVRSYRAVINDKTSLESASQYVADMLDCAVEDFEKKEGK